MNKKILHFQIPIRANSTTRDQFSIEPETLGKFMKMIQEKIGKDFIVIASPCEPSLLSRKDSLYNFNMEQITLAELKDMIKNEN